MTGTSGWFRSVYYSSNWKYLRAFMFIVFLIFKNALFGEGTYLSQEPSLSLHYSPANTTWNKSVIGQRMSCLLVTETINDPTHVKTGINGKQLWFWFFKKKLTYKGNYFFHFILIENPDPNIKSKTSNVPDKYYVVQNNEYVRVKYLLVYAEKSKPKRYDLTLHKGIWLKI